MKRNHFLTGLILLMAIGAPGWLLAEEMKIVAVINDEVITQSELDHLLGPMMLQLQSNYGPEELAQKETELKISILERMVEERLLLQLARRPKPVEVSKGKIGTPPPVEVSELEVEKLLARTKGRFEDEEAFFEALGEQGLAVEDLKNRYRDQITIQKLVDREVASRIVISPGEITAFYEKNKKGFELPPAVQVATILIRPRDSLDRARAKGLVEEIRRKVMAGEDFSQLASRHSDGPNAKEGGKIGFLEKGQSLPEIDAVLFDLKAGEISPVIQTQAGFHLFRIESIRPDRQQALEEVQDQIRNQLFQEKMATRYKEWIDKLKSDAYISLK